MKLAIVGATGLVGETLLKVLKKFEFPFTEIMLVASEKSVGKTIHYQGTILPIISIKEALTEKPNIAIFSAGSAISKQYAPLFAEQGCFVIDNSSAWRMDSTVPLVVPEINASTLTKNTKIIANPNCSTIQMVMALAPLHARYRIKRLVISTYQAVSGTGMKAIDQLKHERAGSPHQKVYAHPIDLNCFPHGGDFLADGSTTEEAKLVHETRKILNDPNLQITATVVRIPVIGGHSEAVNIEFHQPYDLQEVRALLEQTKGLVVQDDPANNLYPMPITAHEQDEVFVGRIRRDLSTENALNLWIVADNVRKGAATNAVQIAQYIAAQGWINA